MEKKLSNRQQKSMQNYPGGKELRDAHITDMLWLNVFLELLPFDEILY